MEAEKVFINVDEDIDVAELADRLMAALFGEPPQTTDPVTDRP